MTSKPDLYPLVITYGDNNDKGASSYLMVQYFRNYIIRPTGSISATSTAESLSSSFICNAANEANSVVPPPYSCAGSFDEWRNGGAAAAPTHRQALLRSISSVACDQPATPVRRARLSHSATTHFRLPIQDQIAHSAATNSPNGRNLTINSESSTNQPNETQNTPSLPAQPTNCQRNLSSNITRNINQRKNPTIANNISNVTPASHNGATNCVSSNRRLKPVNDNEQFICDNQSNNFNNTIPQKVQTRSWTDNFFTKAFEQSNQCRNISDTNDELSNDRCASYARPRSNCDNVNNMSVICDYSPEPTANASLMNPPIQETKMNITNFNSNNFEIVEFADGPRNPIPVTSAARINTVHCHRQSSVDGASFASKDFGSHSNLEDLRGYLHSMTGSEVSSLANLGTPDSPPRATSPTMEVRGLLDKIHNLPSNSDKKHDGAQTANTETKTKRSAMKHRKSSLYMPLSVAPKTSFMGVGRISPAVDNYNTRSIFSHRGWSSRSAPTTPCGASIMPSILTFSQRKISNAGLNTKSSKQNKEESNPLLTECEEIDDVDRSHVQF